VPATHDAKRRHEIARQRKIAPAAWTRPRGQRGFWLEGFRHASGPALTARHTRASVKRLAEAGVHSRGEHFVVTGREEAGRPG
jgi:hypothetical protein